MKFKFKSKVKIVKGFYEGQEGEVKSYYNDFPLGWITYKVKLNCMDYGIRFKKREMELVK